MAYDRHPGFATSVISRSLGVLFISVGLMKLLGHDLMEASFLRWGYTPGFMTLVGVLELVSGILLLSVDTRIWGASVLWFMMLGAMFTHLQHGDPAFMLVPFLVLGFLTLLIYNRTRIFLEQRRAWF